MAFEWDPLKNERLKKTRGVSFEEILKAKFIDIRNHPTKGWQETLLVEWKDYVWIVPFVRGEKGIFLKTIYPSRKLTKRYRRGEPC